jgi:hypothetical protein
MTMGHFLGVMAGASLLTAGMTARAQVSLLSVQRIETSQVLTSTVPVMMVMDGQGNLYVSGQKTGGELFTAKYGPDGSEAWAHSYQGSDTPDDKPVDMVLDADENLCVTAASQGASQDYLTLKFAASGQSVWTNRLDGAGHGGDQPGAMAVDAEGNVYVSGYTYLSSATNAVGVHVFYALTTVSYAPDGTERWRNDYERTSGRRQVHDMILDDTGRVIVSAISTVFADPRSSLDEFIVIALQPDSGMSRQVGVVDLDDGFGLLQSSRLALSPKGEVWVATARRYFPPRLTLTRFDRDLAPQWTQVWTAPHLDPAIGLSGLQVDSFDHAILQAYHGNVDPVTFQDLGLNMNIRKVDGSGIALWSTFIDGAAHQADISTASLVDSSGYSYVAGLSGMADNEYQWMTAKLKPDGSTAWSAPFGDAITNQNLHPLLLALDTRDWLTVIGTAPGLSGAGPDVLKVTYVQLKGSIQRQPAGTFRLEFVRLPGSQFLLQGSDDLFSWTNIMLLKADEAGRMAHDVAGSAGQARGFFRIIPP